MKAVKNVLAILMSVLLWGIILLTALFTFTTLATRDNQKVASLAGFTPLIVQSDSMAPFFETGDLILIRKCDPATLKQGDVITFHAIINNEYALNTHRIAQIQELSGIRQYVTKGDNNEIPDTHIIGDGDIVGKFVGKAAFLGKVMIFLSSSAGFLIVIVLPMLLFFIYQIYHLVMVSINLKKAIALENAQELEKKQNNEADEKLAQAQAALEEAKRLKEEAEAKLARMEKKEEKEDE